MNVITLNHIHQLAMPSVYSRFLVVINRIFACKCAHL